jgi:hypothetical protein
MPRRRRPGTFPAGMRWVLLVVLTVAVGAVYLRARAIDDDSAALATSPVQIGGLPPQVRDIYGSVPSPVALLHSAEALPGLGAIRAHGDTPAVAQAFPFADIGTPRELRSVRRDIRRNLDAINALSDAGGGWPRAAAQTLAEVYSAPVLASLGPAGRQAFAARLAGSARVVEHVRALGYEGVFVFGRRALAQVIYRVSVRVPSGRFLVREPRTWTVTLARERGRWRFVRGFDTA